MAEETYAFIVSGTVVNTALFDNPSQDLLEFFKQQYSLDEIVLAGKNAIIGSSFDGFKFWLEQPYPSWVKNEETNEWEAPYPEPPFDEENPKGYEWNEESLSWQERQPT